MNFYNPQIQTDMHVMSVIMIVYKGVVFYNMLRELLVLLENFFLVNMIFFLKIC